MKKVALITLHGMGKYKPNYYADLEQSLKDMLGDDWAKVSFQNVQYAPILQDPQNELWNDMSTEPNNDLDFVKLRKFLLFGFGDAGTIGYSSNRNREKYIKVQQAIEQTLAQAYLDLSKQENKPVIILAHSLGCQVISNYIYDAQKDYNLFETALSGSEDETKFKKLKSCHHLLTTGCNIPLFVAGIEKANRVAFTRPTTDFIWDNFYDADDVLGYPLKQLGDDYNNMVSDHEINAGGFLSSWTPFSHSQYWDDKDLLRPLVKTLKAHMK
ncbi:hypothetical protein [Shewanella japonica]|uniref:Alpha/beta hydrolase n=1 Tax=Shewanella japonica TaxID=93973 RepID=A0ABN4Y8S4_9GAMM|nr:hypothetical protein [Shewanella japonica]ARD20856.1 hypothetical protein SJ2017_0518 [Shewanella japonica]